MAVHGGANIVTDSLVLSLDAGDPASYPGSGTTWTDLTGNGRNGTLSAAAIGTDVPGVMDFNGSSEFVTISHDTAIAYDATADWCVSIWYSVTGTNNGFVWSKRDGGASYIDAQHSDASDVQNWGLAQSGVGSDSVSTTGIITDDGSKAYNVVWAHEGTANKVHFYVNGVLNVSATKSNTTSGNYGTSNVYIAKIINQEYLPGKVWTFMVHNKMLSAKEALQNFNAHRGRFAKYGL